MSKTPLSNIAKFTGGSGFPERYQGKTSGEYPFIKVSDMNLPSNKKYIFEANNYVDKELLNRLNLQVFKKGTTVFAKVGAAILLNRCRKIVRTTIIDNNMMGATPVNCDENYLFYVLSSFDFGKLVQTGALPSINQSLFDRLQCIDFPLPHQRKIARILTTIDNIIEKTEAAIAKYKAIKQGMMHDLFTRGIDVKTGKLRPKFEDAPELYKESELGWIPKEWEDSSLGDYISFLKSGLSRLLSEQDIGIPVLISGNIQNYEMDFSSLKYWFEVDTQGANVKDYILDKNDILLCFINSLEQIGKAALFKGYWRDCIYTTNLFRIKANGHTDPYFLFQLLVSEKIQREIKLISKPAVNQASFTTGDFLGLRVPLIDSQEQLVIKEKLLAVSNKIKNEEVYREKMQVLKSGLMQDLLTGKREVTPDPEDYKL